MEEKELFEDYEIKSWEFTPRLFKLFGAGTLTVIVAVAAFGQFNLMQSKACDNGMVGKVCQVLDAVYLATTFAGEDNQWASEDYKKQTIEDADITYVDVSNVEPPLKYPEGYFAMTNPEQFAQTPNNSIDVMGMPFPTNPSFPSATFPNPTVPNSPGGADLLNKPAELPKQNNDAVKGEIPDSPFSFGDETASAPKTRPMPNRNSYPPFRRNNRPPRTPRFPNKSPEKLPSDEELAKADTDGKKATDKPEASPSPTDPNSAMNEFNAKVNKKPLEDFADDIVVKTGGDKKIDLTKPFMVEMQGVLDKDGKLDAKKSRFIDDDGDQQMIDVAKSAIEALNNSGLLSYLKDFGAEKVNFTLIQDDKQITAIIRADQPTEEKAKTVSSGINGAIALAKIMNKDQDLIQLMNAAKFTTQGKSFIMNFALPKEDAHKLIDKKLQEARIKKSQTNGADVSSNVNTQSK